jgi:hypothetical protein
LSVPFSPLNQSDKGKKDGLGNEPIVVVKIMIKVYLKQ